MIGVDTGLLAYAVNRGAPEHPRASRLLEDLVNGDVPWALPWPAAHAFLGFVTHPHAVVRGLRPAEAWDFLAAVLASPAVHPLAPTPRHGDTIAEVLAAFPDAASLPPGFETAVLLREHGVRELLTCNRGMRRFPFLAVIDPIRGEPWSPHAPPRGRYRMLAPRPVRRRPRPGAA